MNDADMESLAAELERAIGRSAPVTMRGRVGQAVGLTIDATGIQARIGELCELVTPGEAPVWAEVVGFRHNTALLTPLGPMTGLSMASEVLPTGRGLRCPVGPGLLGRVLDALGNPIDGGGPLAGQGRMPVHRDAVAPLARRQIQQAFVTGLRAIDGLLTLGVGQRIGARTPRNGCSPSPTTTGRRPARRTPPPRSGAASRCASGSRTPWSRASTPTSRPTPRSCAGRSPPGAAARSRSSRDRSWTA